MHDAAISRSPGACHAHYDGSFHMHTALITFSAARREVSPSTYDAADMPPLIARQVRDSHISRDMAYATFTAIAMPEVT